METEQKEIEHF